MLLAESLLGSSSTAANYIEDVFSTYLYTGTGASQTISNGVDLSTKGGMVWIKSRSAATNNFLFDTSRGTTKEINSNTTDAEATLANSLTAFNTDGFTVNSATGIGVNAATYVSWTFREQAKFFDVVTYTGDGSGFSREIPHSLNSQPGFVIIKRTDSTSNWWVTSRYSNGTYAIGNGTTDFALNSTNAASAVADATGPGGVFGSGTFKPAFIAQSTAANASGATYVAYLFAHDAGGFGVSGSDNVISCGSFTSNSSDVATITLGYEPQFVLMKSTSTTGHWWIADNMRGFTVSGEEYLRANSTGAEASGTNIRLTNTGFIQNSTTGAATTYIYIAIRRGPMKTPTSGTSVFALQAYSDGVGGAALAGSTQSFVNLRPDLSVFANRAGSTNNFQFADLLRGYQQTTGPGADTLTTPTLKTTNSNAEATSGNAIYVLPANGSNPPEVRFSSDSVGAKLGYIFRRAPGFFDVVCYTGNGVAGRTVSHNLTVAPELMFVKSRSDGTSQYGWATYVQSLGNTKYLYLNTIDSEGVYTQWNNTSPTATNFTLGSYIQVNASGSNFVAYLFASCPGVSKVGSYTGTGTTKQIDCGFTGGARFVLIKRTDSTGDWYVWDSARGIVAGNDSYLLLNSTAAEVTNTDYVDTYSAGFEISSTAPAAINANGGSFIFFAVA